MKNGQKILAKALSGVILLAIIGLFGINSADKAYSAEGDGSDTSGTAADCNSPNALQDLCGNPAGSKGGGASWRIFSASNPTGLKTDVSSVIDTSDAASALDSAKSECASTGWFASYGWDILHGNSGNRSSSEGQIGPANRNSGTLIARSSTRYNSYNAVGNINTLAANGFSNNTRITNSLAIKLYNLNKNQNVSRIPSDVGWFCAEQPESIEGQSKVEFSTGGNTADTGSFDEGTVERETSFDNAVRTGRIVTFTHKITGYASDTRYSVSQEVIYGSVYVTKKNGNDASGTFSAVTDKNYNGTSAKVTYKVRIAPGSKVCQTLSYDKGKDGSWEHNSTVCAEVVYPSVSNECSIVANIWNANSASISSGTTSSISKSQDSTNSTGWQNKVYAKPSDSVSFGHCYFPGAQKVLTTDLKSLLEPENKFSISINNSNYLSSYSGTRNWKYIKNDGAHDENRTSSQFTGTTGRMDSVQVNSSVDGTTIPTTAVGQTITETLGSNHYGTLNYAASHPASHGYGSSSASIKVPYNYTASISTSIDDNNPVYAGESMSVSTNINIGQRWNATTNGTYATKTVSSTAHLYMFYAPSSSSHSSQTVAGSPDVNYYCNNHGFSGCKQLDGDNEVNKTYNPNSVSTGSNTSVFGNSYLAYDLPAGYQICVGAAIYPYSVSGDTDMGTGNGQTYYSAPSCVTIAKKPTFIVRGGNVESASTINTKVAEKGYLGTNALTSKYFFGSWAEFGLTIGNGNVIGFTSGNVGVSDSHSGTLFSNVYCDRFNPMTIANNSCSGTTLRASSGVGDTTRKNNFLAYYKLNNPSSIAFNQTFSRPSDINYTGGGTAYYKGSGNFALTGTWVSNGSTAILYVPGTLKITGNVVVTANNSYNNLSDAPQMIIYAKQGISIESNVTQIDAILITDGVLNTCSNSCVSGGRGTSNADANHLQLNAPVIARKVVLNRTYGAGPSSNSAQEAERFNYSLRTYLWSADEATSDGKSIYSVYQTELSPRK